MEPRGIRNNNPGNIRRGDHWQGMADEQPDPSFVTFVRPIWGLRAIGKTLMTYQDKHGCDTVRNFIERWAPPSENNTEAYVHDVADALQTGPDDRINIHSTGTMAAMIEAIVQHENGEQPYDRRDVEKVAAICIAGG